MSSAEFAEYLVRIAGVDDDQQPPVGMWAGTGNTIGAIALRMDLLELEQIDQILELQKQEGELFGQIAVRMGYLSQDQVDRLVQLQQVYQQLEIGGHYVVNGHISIDRFLVALGEFNQFARQPQNQERPAH